MSEHQPEVTIVTVEANSVEEAEELLRQQIPDGLVLLSKKTIRTGQPTVLTATGETLEEAYENAIEMAPEDATISSRKAIVPEAIDVSLPINAMDETSAAVEALRDSSLCSVVEGVSSAFVKSVTLITRGRKGILGIGRKANSYAVVVHQSAVAQVSARQKVCLEGTIGPHSKTLCPMCGKLVNEEDMSGVPVVLESAETGQRTGIGKVCFDCFGQTLMGSSWRLGR